MKLFDEFLTENMGSMSALPPDLAKLLLRPGFLGALFGQNSAVEVIRNPNEATLNKQINEITKRISHDPNDAIYVTWKVKDHPEKSYNWDKGDYDVSHHDAYVVLGKWGTRESTWQYNAYIPKGKEIHTAKDAIDLKYHYSDLPKKIKLSDIDFSKVDAIYVIYHDMNRLHLRGERTAAQTRNDPLAKPDWKNDSGNAVTTVDRNNAQILVYNKMKDAEQAIKDAIAGVSLVTTDTKGNPTLSIDGLILQLRTLRKYVNGYDTDYVKTGLTGGSSTRVEMSELKKVIATLDIWKFSARTIK